MGIPSPTLGATICDCWKWQVYQHQKLSLKHPSSQLKNVQVATVYMKRNVVHMSLEPVNQSVNALGETPIIEKKL